MDDRQLMRDMQAVGDLADELHRVGHGRLAHAVVAVAEDLALDVRHHHVHQPVLGLAHAHDVADVRVREPDAQRRFPTKARHGVLVLGERGREDLDRVPLLRRDVVREVDVRHAALTDLADDVVAAVEHFAGHARVARGGAGLGGLVGAERRRAHRGRTATRRCRRRRGCGRRSRWSARREGVEL